MKKQETENLVSDHNGSDRHKRYKSRVANIIRRSGYTVFGDNENEIAIQTDRTKAPYYLDICAVSGSRVVCVEIDGYRGHNSRRSIRKDAHRTTAIIEYFKAQGLKAQVYRFAFWQLKDASDQLIAKELQLC